VEKYGIKIEKTMNINKLNVNNKESWIWKFHEDKNISVAVASLITMYLEAGYDFNKNKTQQINSLQSVHNINKTQAKKAIEIANKYIF
tara:strand:+ start:321 stop:584 length:264 start_codon:yes stop_codon:yes gene_type:complete